MRGRKSRAAIPAPVREATLCRLEAEQERYVRLGCARSFRFEFRGEYLYMSASESTPFGGGDRFSRLCRIRYLDDPELWVFEIYKYSDDAYDEENDFPFTGGAPEECLAVAADFYLLQYSALDAGSSREEVPVPAQGEPFGPAALLPPLAGPHEIEVPEAFPAEAAPAAGTLLADLGTFLDFVRDRTFHLGARTLGLGRADLAEINDRMSRPVALSQRPVLSHVPRVQCLFQAARALGLLRVDGATGKANGTAGIGEFLALPDSTRLWATLEAIWNRVDWRELRPRALGHTESLQAGRYLLADHLARRTRALEFDGFLTLEAEVLEIFLFPLWRDAGLVDLAFDRRMKVMPYSEKRSTRLRRLTPTTIGRPVFALLGERAPRPESSAALPPDRNPSGKDLIGAVGYAGLFALYPGAFEEE